MLSLSNFVAPYLSRERTKKQQEKKKKMKNRKQMTRIKIERLHLHHKIFHVMDRKFNDFILAAIQPAKAIRPKGSIQ